LEGCLVLMVMEDVLQQLGRGKGRGEEMEGWQ
jgi:hypothetical protein